jgi:hypothetical protein
MGTHIHSAKVAASIEMYVYSYSVMPVQFKAAGFMYVESGFMPSWSSGV